MTFIKRFASLFLCCSFLCVTLPASAAITFLASRSLPADNGTLDDAAPRSIAPPAGLRTGDFVYLVGVVRSPTATLSLSNIAGQAWTAKEPQTVNGQARIRVFTTRFNGMWRGQPAVQTDERSGKALTLALLAFRPMNAANTWSVDGPQTSAWFGSAESPFDITASGRKTIAPNTVTVAAFITAAEPAWSLRTQGWSNPHGAAQIRNTTGGGTSLALAYRIDTAPGGTSTVTNRQMAGRSHAGRWLVETFAETAGLVAKKWHPGHYIWTGTIGTETTDVSDAVIREIAAMPNVQGMKHSVYWRALEPARGVYDFSKIDRYLSILKPAGKRLIIEFQDRSFGVQTGATPTLPDYLAKEPNGGGGWFVKRDANGVSRGVVAKYWLPANMDRYIALWRAFADRYDAEPHLEAIMNDESSPGFQDGVIPADWSRSATAAQLNRLTTAWAQMFRRTIAVQKINNLVGEVSGLVDHCYRHGIGMGGPDVLPAPHNDTSGARILRGAESDSPAYAPFDYRGSVPIIYEVQGPDMGGKEGDPSFRELYDHAHDILRASHLAWLRKTWGWMERYQRTGIMWHTQAVGGRQNGHLPFKAMLEAGRLPLATACPTQYHGACE